MNSVFFNFATESDVEGIVNLCNECFEEATDINLAKKLFLQESSDKNQLYIVGKLNNEIIAHTKITIIPTIFKKMGTYAILNHVCVKNEYRRHNIATKMLDIVEKICIQKNCKSIKLWSLNSRIPAHALYKKYGFKIDDASFFSKDI